MSAVALRIQNVAAMSLLLSLSYVSSGIIIVVLNNLSIEAVSLLTSVNLQPFKNVEFFTYTCSVDAFVAVLPLSYVYSHFLGRHRKYCLNWR